MKKILLIVLGLWLCCMPTGLAFDEIEDLSRTGTLGNKEAIPLPQNEWENVTILGPATATREQMTAFIENNAEAPELNCTIAELVDLYYEEAGAEGVRPDVAICQALIETGFFCYRNAAGEGNVDAWQNNYCGLGSTDAGVAGASFKTPREGVRAQIQHLLAYAQTSLPKSELVDPRYKILVTRYPQYHGTVKYWIGLNGRWAVPGEHYGQNILRLWYAACE